MSAQSRRTGPPRLRQLVRVEHNSSQLFSLSVILTVGSFDHFSMTVYKNWFKQLAHIVIQLTMGTFATFASRSEKLSLS